MLRRASWSERAPRLGVLAWQTTSWSILTAVMLAGVGAGRPHRAGRRRSGYRSGHLCHVASPAVLDTGRGALAGAIGLTLTLGVIARVSLGLFESLWGARRTRAHQHQGLRLLARPDQRLGVLVLDHPACEEYASPVAAVSWS